MDEEAQVEETHTFCCGGKKCPAIRKEEGGLVISDELADVPTLTVSTLAEIRFTAEQARELKIWLEKYGF